MGRNARRVVLTAVATAVVLQLVVVAPSPPPAGAAALGDPRALLAVSTIAPAPVETAVPRAPEPIERRASYLLVDIDRETPITARPGGGRIVGTMPASSRFYAIPTVAWVRRVSRDGRFGLVDVPYAADRRSGWIALRGLETASTRVSVVADLSAHRITVRRGSRVLFRAPAATGAAGSPTPIGRYFVTDRIPFSGGPLGTFAFGISGIQPRLPSGWTGGDQLAIHGTNAPSTIGQSASAGCLRVSETVLERLKPLLRLGTPVLVEP
jgi:lipoprotein-anchoring transpeptidase ErfK/SrfK